MLAAEKGHTCVLGLLIATGVGDLTAKDERAG